MRKNISKKRLNNYRRVKRTRRHNMKGGEPIQRNGIPIKRIVLYALSANPPTKAHENIIQQLSDNYDAVFVWASTNLLKLDPNHSSYDPLYKDENTRSKFLKNVLTELSNVKVDYDPVGTPAKYNDTYTGISVKKFIDANLEPEPKSYTTINDSRIDLNQFKLKEASLQGDVDFLKTCRINTDDIVELWVCFGLDVVRDTPTWTPNNVFLTRATGIIMISREGESPGDGLFSRAYENKKNTPFYKMPFLDCTTINKEGQFIKKDLKFNQDTFSELFKPENKDMHDLVKGLLDNSTTKFTELNEKVEPSRPETDKRKEFLDWLIKVDDKFSLLIEESPIKLNDAFASASSTKVRNLAVQSILGNRRSNLDTTMLNYVNCRIIEDIYTRYGTPTIPEQLAIIVAKGSDTLKNNLADKIKTTKNYADVVSNLKENVLQIMK